MLQEPSLFRQKAWINGAWVDADTGATFAVLNPADGAQIAVVPNQGPLETQRAITAAASAGPLWRAKTAKERAYILRAWADLMLVHREDLAYLMTLEQGKPLQEARGEITYAASFLEWFGEEAKRIYGDIIPGHQPDKRLLVFKQPIGVCAAITPWNFPSAMITRKVAPALAAGCTMVLKPAEQTPLSALALAELAHRAEVPHGVFNVVTGDAAQSVVIGQELTRNPVVRKLSFTGSTEVGRILMRQSADTVKKLSLELGGNAAFIVFEDADLDAALEGAIASKYRNAGQTCVCANRLYVHENILQPFTDALVQRVRSLRVGSGLDAQSHIGPLIDQSALEKVQDLLKDAQQKGAQVILGGNAHPLGGTFFEPTILVGATADMRLAQEEIFGPVAPIFVFREEEEVIHWANQTEYGLASYFYTQNLSRMFRVAEQLDYGIIGVNTGIISTETAPFGGMKQSGLGREGSKYGIEDYLEIKYVCVGVS